MGDSNIDEVAMLVETLTMVINAAPGDLPGRAWWVRGFVHGYLSVRCASGHPISVPEAYRQGLLFGRAERLPLN